MRNSFVIKLYVISLFRPFLVRCSPMFRRAPGTIDKAPPSMVFIGRYIPF